MQPCDVRIFQSYKHWHSKAIQYVIETLDFEYTVASFLRDLPEVHKRTFTKSTIQSAFKKAGIWPIDCGQVIKNMAKFIKEATPERLPENPKTVP
jgi:hypothetical protein